MKTTIDHLVIVATDLDTGCAFVTDALGVALQPGGVHSRMGTHNRLLHLGPGLYLEVIAVDPSAIRPDRARWFGLDQLAPHSPARLATWVARTDDIHAARDACPGLVGDVEPMTRGTLNWQITVPADGSLPMDGSIPTPHSMGTWASSGGHAPGQGLHAIGTGCLSYESGKNQSDPDGHELFWPGPSSCTASAFGTLPGCAYSNAKWPEDIAAFTRVTVWGGFATQREQAPSPRRLTSQPKRNAAIGIFQ